MLSWRQVLIHCFYVFLVISPSASEWRSNGTNCVGVPADETAQLKGNASIILDEILTATSKYLREINSTQTSIPDQHSNFSFLFLTGNLSLTDGKVSGYDKIKRVGTAEIKYFDKGTTSNFSVKFGDAAFFYKIKVHIPRANIKGTIKTSLEQLTMTINVSVNMTSLCKKIDSVKIENLDSVKVKTDLDVWIPNYLADSLVKSIMWIYQNSLLPFIEFKTTTAVQSILDSINLDELLRPPKSSPV